MGRPVLRKCLLMTLAEHGTATPTTARDRVLGAALDCFVAKGYEATTINDIERAAGLLSLIHI